MPILPPNTPEVFEVEDILRDLSHADSGGAEQKARNLPDR
jgi:hypothetical protein